jgi:hypothetical protein
LTRDKAIRKKLAKGKVSGTKKLGYRQGGQRKAQLLYNEKAELMGNRG